MLILKSGSLWQNNRWLLDQVDLEVRPGEAVLIWGLNGAGKSSLLDALSGWRSLDQGYVSINNDLLSAWNPNLRAQHLSYLTQHHGVYFDGEVGELLGALIIKDKRINKAVLDSLSKTFGVGDLLDRRFMSLSGGEQAKVSLLRVMLQLSENLENYRGRYLLLDEPLAHLDIFYQQAVYENLTRLKQQGLGLVMVIHDLNQAWRYADRFFILLDGKLHECKTAEAVLEFFELHYGMKLQMGKIEGRVFFINS